MTWKKLLDTNRVDAHATSRQELDDLRRAIKRNLKDASLEGLSADNKFGLAYEAALLVAKTAISAAGYRVKGLGAHQTTFTALKFVLGEDFSDTASYLDRCRRKRNDLSYDTAGVATAAEAAELLKEARKLKKTVEYWIKENHPSLL